MTTDAAPTDDRAVRLEALRERRPASRSALRAKALEPTAVAATQQQRARHHHAATGGRILAGSLSAATALGLMGAMAHATNRSTTAPTTTTDAAVPTVIVVHRPAGPNEIAAPAAPVVTPTRSAPVTTSRGS